MSNNGRLLLSAGSLCALQMWEPIALCNDMHWAPLCNRDLSKKQTWNKASALVVLVSARIQDRFGCLGLGISPVWTGIWNNIKTFPCLRCFWSLQHKTCVQWRRFENILKDDLVVFSISQVCARICWILSFSLSHHNNFLSSRLMGNTNPSVCGVWLAFSSRCFS